MKLKKSGLKLLPLLLLPLCMNSHAQINMSITFNSAGYDTLDISANVLYDTTPVASNCSPSYTCRPYMGTAIYSNRILIYGRASNNAFFGCDIYKSSNPALYDKIMKTISHINIGTVLVAKRKATGNTYGPCTLVTIRQDTRYQNNIR